MPPLPPAIFFDLDDTLIAFDGVSEEVWTACCARVVREYALPVSPDALWDAVRARKDWFWSDPARHRAGRMDIVSAQRGIVQSAFATLGLDAADAALFLADTYSRERQLAVRLLPKTHETLAALRADGVRLAMLTNGVRREQRAKIDRFDLERYFELILVEEEIGFGKPDPRVFTLALDRMGLGPKDVWMVGDNLSWDVGAPQALGIYAIWNDWRGGGLPAGSTVVPDRIVRGVWEIEISRKI